MDMVLSLQWGQESVKQKNLKKKKINNNLTVLNETNKNNCPSLMSVVFIFIFIFWGSI